MKTRYRVAAFAGGFALLAAACGEPPAEEGGGSTDSEFLACMVSDSGGINDKSFNESSWRGVENAHDNGYTIEPKFTESQSDADYEQNVSAMVSEDCGIVVTVGFLLADVTQNAAEANSDERFAIVDYQYVDDEGVPVEIDNIQPLVFNTHEAAYLAGYLAAGVTETGKVGTWGGAKIPTVTIFMDGFADGIERYNADKGTDVELLGWNKETQEGEFTNDFENTGLAKQISENLIQQDADILLPVAGPIGESAAVAAEEAGDVNIIWVDSDGYESLSKYGSIIITSVMKGMDAAVEASIKAASEDNYTNEPYVGTLENDGVGLAPYHDFEDQIPQELKDEVEQLKEDIISGELEVKSDAAF